MYECVPVCVVGVRLGELELLDIENGRKNKRYNGTHKQSRCSKTLSPDFDQNPVEHTLCMSPTAYHSPFIPLALF